MLYELTYFLFRAMIVYWILLAVCLLSGRYNNSPNQGVNKFWETKVIFYNLYILMKTQPFKLDNPTHRSTQ